MTFTFQSIFQLMAAAPTVSAWSDVKIELLEQELGLILPDSYVRFLRFAGPDYLVNPDGIYGDSFAWIVDLQQFKRDAGFVYQFQNRDFLIEEHQGYHVLFFRTDARNTNPHIMSVSDSDAEPVEGDITLEHWIARKVSIMMGLG